MLSWGVLDTKGNFHTLQNPTNLKKLSFVHNNIKKIYIYVSDCQKIDVLGCPWCLGAFRLVVVNVVMFITLFS